MTGQRKHRLGAREEPRHDRDEPASGALIGRRMGPVPPGRRTEPLRSAETRGRGMVTQRRDPCTRGSGRRHVPAGRQRRLRL